MKKNLVLAILFFATTALINKSEAQVQVSLNLNIGSQPVWGPTGYNYVRYYYMPDINAYYYVPTGQYVYFESGRWIFAASLPERCAHYDLYRGYKVVINEPRAYLYNNVHRTTYVKYKGCYGKQVVIRDSRDPRYVVVNKSYSKGHGHAYGHDKH